MLQVSVDNACSFARSMDEDLSSPEQFVPATSGWLEENQPVIASLSHAMALRLSRDEGAASVAEAVVGYMVRLMCHAEANQTLRNQLECEQCVSTACPSFGEPTNEHRKFCCKRTEALRGR